MECYERSSQVAQKLLGVTVSDSTIYRLTDAVGESVKEVIDGDTCRDELALEEEDLLYVQVDGSMLLTRSESWKEVKLGRVFKSSAILPESKGRRWIRDSEYVAHFGNHVEFEDLMSKLIDEPYRKHEDQIVFIGDGARWQWSWAESEYPNSVQILDYYHAMEHIGRYLQVVKNKKGEVHYVMKKMGTMLKERGLPSVERYLDNIPKESKVKQEAYSKLMTYINNNRSKMQYPEYIKKGYLIGSGAIESAHRTVLQKRMKQSGQRWSKRGLINMVKLRSASMSGSWNEIQTIIRLAA